jgi:hypothetical protein
MKPRRSTRQRRRRSEIPRGRWPVGTPDKDTAGRPAPWVGGAWVDQRAVRRIPAGRRSTCHSPTWMRRRRSRVPLPWHVPGPHQLPCAGRSPRARRPRRTRPSRRDRCRRAPGRSRAAALADPAGCRAHPPPGDRLAGLGQRRRSAIPGDTGARLGRRRRRRVPGVRTTSERLVSQAGRRVRQAPRLGHRERRCASRRPARAGQLGGTQSAAYRS